jgi:uncharacterized repeat protein (TIGR03803 family)
MRNLHINVTLAILFVLTILASTSAQTQTFTVLHYFTGGSDGGSPTSGLTVGGPGTLFGTTAGAGDWFGTVFKMTEKGSGWTFAPLYDFTGGSDGGYPYAGVVLGRDGALYGTTWAGGYGVGTVFQLRPPATACKTAICYWNETVLHAFTGNITDGGFPGYGNVTFDQAGNIYGTASNLGGSTCGVVWELSPSGGAWTESVLYNFAGKTDGCNPFSGVIFDGAGNLYGNTANGGSEGAGTVYQLVLSNGNWMKHTLADLNGNTGTHPVGTLSMDRSGNLYGTTLDNGPNGGGTVFELSASRGWAFSLVYAFASCDPGAGMTIAPDGSLYGVCQAGGAFGHGWVFEMPPNCNQTCGPNDLHDFDGSDGSYANGPVVFDASGNLYGTTYGGGNTGQGCNEYGCGVVWEITP